jgi:AraC-like DNA-binding protein
MKPLININHSFIVPGMEKLCPLVTSFHCYPKYSKLMSNKITASGWAIEYHSKYAGKVFLKSLSNPIDRERQTVHIYAPGCVYWEDTRDADCPIQETYLYFTGAESCGLDSFASSKFKFARFKDPDNMIGSLFMSAATACTNLGDDSFWLIQSYFMRMINHLLQGRHLDGFNYLLSASEANSNSKAADFSHMVHLYLKKNTGRYVTLKEIATYMKTSESLLSHRFKEETGTSPIVCHVKLRIEFAKSLILKGEKLKSIAEMTGFNDEYHLSKVFKLTTGITPSAFRKSDIA